MALSMHQVQRQTQRLIMTPQMQQSIQLLQMNSLQLEQLIRTEMLENPFLEIVDDEEGLQSDLSPGLESAVDEYLAAPDSGLSEQERAKQEVADAWEDAPEPTERELSRTLEDDNLDGADRAAPEETTTEFESFAETDADWNSEYSDSDTSAYASVSEDGEENDFTTYTAIAPSLLDNLNRQLHLSILDGLDFEIGEFIVGNLTDDGYLDCSLENMALMLKFPAELIRPDIAGKPEFVDRRLRRSLATMLGGTAQPEAFDGMKRRELLLRCWAAFLRKDYESLNRMKREEALRRMIAVRMRKPEESFLETPAEELVLEVIALRMKTTPERVFDVLEVIQDFEPTGVGARNLAECLRLQCEERNIRNRLLYAILDDYLDLLLQKKFREIARPLGVSEEEVGDVFRIISKLEPRPGRSLTKDRPRFIKPDVFVKKVDGKYLYFLNEGDAGRLMVASKYRRLMKGQDPNSEKNLDGGKMMVEETAPTLEPDFATTKYKNAVWLIKNIEKRKSTILRVTEAIMEHQKQFLEKGIEHLRPLTLRDIGEIVGMHESTIARVTTNKYVETPRGIYELKYFFNSGLETEEGDMAASRAIKEMLTQMINAEDTRRPLSDQKIADLLKKKGINIARRTVAKYREQLKILPARLRRAVK